MPRDSPFKIVLSGEEREMLQFVTRKYTSPYIDVIRAKIILYAADGLENKEIADRLEIPRQIVCKWRKRFFERGLVGLVERPRRGRPPRFSPRGRDGDQSARL
ncbi:MAG: helix-turn-helix domain-containing protein [Planctomycetota bacterium]